MSRFKVWNEEVGGNIRYVRLNEDQGYIDVSVVNERGDIIWNICGITPRGTLRVYSGIDVKNRDGIEVDEDGKIVMEDE